jgi:hypothetical protein
VDSSLSLAQLLNSGSFSSLVPPGMLSSAANIMLPPPPTDFSRNPQSPGQAPAPLTIAPHTISPLDMDQTQPRAMMTTGKTLPVVPAPRGGSQPGTPAQQQQQQHQQQQQAGGPPAPGYVDITAYLNVPQKEAAKKLGVPTSTLSKRWKEACRFRKWPYRTVQKLDREINTLLHNLPREQTNWPPELEQVLGNLLRKRQMELSTTVIRL